MGLIKMVTSAISSGFKDQVVEVFECANMSNKVLGVPGTRVLRSGTVNNQTDNVISNGSVFFRKNIINNAAEKINPTIFAVIDEKIIVFLDTENFLKCPEKAIIAANRERMNINKILSVKNSIIL